MKNDENLSHLQLDDLQFTISALSKASGLTLQHSSSNIQHFQPSKQEASRRDECSSPPMKLGAEQHFANLNPEGGSIHFTLVEPLAGFGSLLVLPAPISLGVTNI